MTSLNSDVLLVYLEYFITDFLTTLNGSGGRNNGRRGSYDHRQETSGNYLSNEYKQNSAAQKLREL